MKLNRGMNLGGYLSQCIHEQSHYETFITESDIERIASWGFDHVRIPVDCEVLEKEDGSDRPEGYALVQRVMNWCTNYNLDVVLDLHKAYGYDFNDAGNAEKNNLFTSIGMQQRFVQLWVKIASRFGSYSNVAFELLNEVVEKDNAKAWNQLIKKTVEAIREVTYSTPIIYGGIQWNSVKTLKLLDVPKDDNIIFTFHFYEPFIFTHQKAYWVDHMDIYRDNFYPETMEYYCKLVADIGEQGDAVRTANASTMGPEFIQEMVQEAIDAAKNAGARLYCGEFGVIDQAPVDDTLRWFADVDKVFRDSQIGCSLWSYKAMDFGLTEMHYDPVRKAIIDILTK